MREELPLPVLLKELFEEQLLFVVAHNYDCSRILEDDPEALIKYEFEQMIKIFVTDFDLHRHLLYFLIDLDDFFFLYN